MIRTDSPHIIGGLMAFNIYDGQIPDDEFKSVVESMIVAHLERMLE